MQCNAMQCNVCMYIYMHMYTYVYIYGHANEKMMLNHISPICSQPLFQCGELNANLPSWGRGEW
jgi:hypothetical protein